MALLPIVPDPRLNMIFSDRFVPLIFCCCWLTIFYRFLPNNVSQKGTNQPANQTNQYLNLKKRVVTLTNAFFCHELSLKAWIDVILVEKQPLDLSALEIDLLAARDVSVIEL